MKFLRTVTIAFTIAVIMCACPAIPQEQPASAAREEQKADTGNSENKALANEPNGNRQDGGYLVLGTPIVPPSEIRQPSEEEVPSGASPALLEKLQGLRKALPGDLDPDKQIILNPEVMPMYLPDGKRLAGREFMEAIMSGDYMPEPYLDKDKEIKAFVFRMASPEEKKQFLSMMERESRAEEPPRGKDAKPFSVTDIKGKKYSLDKLKGKIVVVNFWFMECRPCRMEIPELNKVVDKYGGKGVVFLGMSTNSKAQIEKFLEKNEFKYNIVPDSIAVAGTYGVTGFPTHMIIDRDSKVAYFSSGYGPGTIDELTGAIEQLIKK